MLLLTILASFGMFTVILLVGYAFGYSAGYKADRTLKQQISKLKGTIKKQQQSAQLAELTAQELQERQDWDMRSKLAELTGNPVTAQFDKPVNDDLASMEHTF